MMNSPGTGTDRMSDGFLERGVQVTRLEAFVDAAFAFSLTMLVSSTQDGPRSTPAIVVARSGWPAFAGTCLLVAMFWPALVRWSRRYGMDDRRSTMLSLLLVFLVLVYMYPLRMLFGTFFAWITGGWLPWPIEKLQSLSELAHMFMVYALAFGTMSLVIAGLFAHALQHRNKLGLSVEEAAQTAGEVTAWRLSAAIAALSFLIAWLWPVRTPNWTMGLPGLVYFLMNLSWPLQRWAIARARMRFQHEQDGGVA